jgi:hypothetical protein
MMTSDMDNFWDSLSQSEAEACQSAMAGLANLTWAKQMLDDIKAKRHHAPEQGPSFRAALRVRAASEWASAAL